MVLVALDKHKRFTVPWRFFCFLHIDRVALEFNGPCAGEKTAGGGARTHTILRSLDFESSASANSATPAFGGRSQRIRVSCASSTFPLLNGDYGEFIARNPSGGPRISRKIIASRKLDFNASIVAMPVLESGVVETFCIAAAEAAAGSWDNNDSPGNGPS